MIICEYWLVFYLQERILISYQDFLREKILRNIITHKNISLEMKMFRNKIRKKKKNIFVVEKNKK